MPSSSQIAATLTADGTSGSSRGFGASAGGHAGDFWGGLAAMLVALPSAIAFGVTIYGPLGAQYAPQGALAGILGTIALGIVAPLFGGTRRLITAPCAPAAAVLSAFALEMMSKRIAPEAVLMMMLVIALLAALWQIAFGVLRFGLLIKYMPYPVASGYMTGVGVIILLSQIPKFLGLPKDMPLRLGLASPGSWRWEGVAVGAATIAAMVLAPKLTKAIPAAIVALLAGMTTYLALAARDRSMLKLAGNALVIGPFSVATDGLVSKVAAHWRSIGNITVDQIQTVLFPALTLAVLLSIDTLKTSVVLDAMTRTRHDSNRELIGQGLGNLASMAIGGVAGSGQMGATLVNVSSGAESRLSGIVEGSLALVAFLLLGKFMAWIPIAALAGILIVVGIRMFDWHAFHMLTSKETILDFGVIAVVVAVAVWAGLIPASATGVGLAILLFVRKEIGGSVVRRKTYGDQRFSKQARLPYERSLLEVLGRQTVIFELQGSLFFGTSDQIYTAVEPELNRRKYVILDMRRVDSIDFTAAHTLQLLEDMLRERNAYLLFSHLPLKTPSGQDMREYLAHTGLADDHRHSMIFSELNLALQWVEDRMLQEAGAEESTEVPLDLREIEIFKQRKPETLVAFEAAMTKRTAKPGERIFNRGDMGAELFLIRRGKVRIFLPLEQSQREHHLATFGRGDFFGELSFLDKQPRSADAVALTETELFVLPREAFDRVTAVHHMLATNLLEGLATTIALRLRSTNRELEFLQES